MTKSEKLSSKEFGEISEAALLGGLVEGVLMGGSEGARLGFEPRNS